MASDQTFYILENETLGIWHVHKVKSPPGRSVSQDELNEKLYQKYPHLNPYLTLVSNDGEHHGVERWLSKVSYRINKEPEKSKELKQLLMAGWDYNDTIETSTLTVVSGDDNMFRQLVKYRENFTRCLNNAKFQTYQEKKSDPEFLKRISREKVLRNMKKTGKRPKQSTIDKYQIKDDEIKYTMEEPLGIIYKITSPSGKTYVGQTVRSFEKRMQEHRQETSGCTWIKRAIQKYGDEMKYEIIEENVPHEQLDEREIYWIKELHSLAPSGYNLTTGGQSTKEYSQELKDKIRDIKNTQKIDKDGYMGYVTKMYNLFYPKLRQHGETIRISYGGFQTEDEAIEVLKEYTKDPDNFTPINNRSRNKNGSVTKSYDKWTARYKGIYLGTYDTEEEAWGALEKYLKDPESIPSFKRNIGNITNQPNGWRVIYRHKCIGTYDTEEDARKALNRYIEEPENFITPGVQRKQGSVTKNHNKWIVSHKGIYIGNYETEEEGEEALNRYIEDPENFVKPEKKLGSVYKEHNRWKVKHKNKCLGTYETKERAEEVREIYQRDPENFVKTDHIPTKVIGFISKRGNRWRLRTKCKQIGTYATKEEAEEVRLTIQSSL